MYAKIYRPARTAMQAGQSKTKSWVLEFEPETPRMIDPLMGWTSSSDMRRQVELRFDTREEAIDYAVRNGIPHQVIEPKERRRVVKSYSDNFAYDRKAPWTH